MTRQPLSVLIPCGDSADVIQDCLESVKWADEIVVVDSYSRDGTLEIARRYAARILQHEYYDSATQKNWAIPQVQHEWLLIVDSDERVTDALRQEIEMQLANPEDYAGFQIPRLNHAWGTPLRHGGNYPDYQLRLFKRDCGRYQPKRVHAHVILEGRCGVLRQPLMHYGQRSMSQVTRHLLGEFTTWEAEERWRQGVRFSRRSLLLRPLGAFCYRAFYLRGFRDGVPGLIMAGVWASYIFITYAKMWEMEQMTQPRE